MRMRGWNVIPVMVVFLVLAGVAAVSAKYALQAVPDLYAEADLVCLAVVGETAATGEEEGMVYQKTVLQVKKVFKGKEAGKAFDAGTRRYTTWMSDPSIQFPSPGTEVVVFLRAPKPDDGPYKTPWILANQHQGIVVKGASEITDWDGFLADLSKGCK